MKIYARIEVFDGETGRDIVDAEASADCVSDALNDAYELAWGKLNENLDEPEVNEGTDWWIDDEDEDEFSLGLIERPEPTMADLNAQRLWDRWMASASADPRAALGVSIPQRFIMGIDPECPPDSYYVFSDVPVLTHYDLNMADSAWTAREPVAFTEANKRKFAEVVNATFGSHSLSPSGYDQDYSWPNRYAGFEFEDSDHDFTD